MTAMAAQPKNPLIKMPMTDPLMMLPNNRKQSEIGNENSLMMFIGNMTQIGSKSPLKYPKNRLKQCR